MERWLADGCALAPEVELTTGELPPPPPRLPPLPSKAHASAAVVREGYLEKLPVKSTFGKWQRRYLVLSVDGVAWQLSATSSIEQPRGWMALTGSSEVALDDPASPSLLQIRSAPHAGSETLTLRASTSEAAGERQQRLREWHGAFKRTVCELAIAATSSAPTTGANTQHLEAVEEAVATMSVAAPLVPSAVDVTDGASP